MGGTIIHEHYNELPSFLPSFRVRVHVHGRVAVLVATPLSSIVPSVIYGSTLSVAPAHNPSKVRKIPDMMSAWEEGVMEKLAQ